MVPGRNVIVFSLKKDHSLGSPPCMLGLTIK